MDVPKLHASALVLFEAARGIGQYDVAYHGLAAALHAAEAMNDAAACEEIERLAEDCRRSIDAQHPGHKLSTSTAQRRGHASVYKQLAVTAVSARLRIQSIALHRKTKGRPQAPLEPPG